jgi:hypothetical protein
MTTAQNAIAIMREPASELLGRHGVRYRVKHEGAVTWYNMEKCPACGHSGYQCGVSESVGDDGKLYHGVKCWHVADNGFGTDTHKYEDFLTSLGALTFGGHSLVEGMPMSFKKKRRPSGQDFDGLPPTATKMALEPPRPANPEFVAVLRKRLRENEAAMTYLAERGLTMETVAHFRLGLSTPYENKAGDTQENALVYPLRGAEGRIYGRYGYYNIPGLTAHPTDKNGWMSGSPRAYYATPVGARTSIFVCEGAKDVWRHWQALQGSKFEKQMLLVTSTHGSAFPEEWKDPDYWSHWEHVYLAEDNDEAGDFIATNLASYIPREARRVLVPRWYGKDWTDFWQSGGTVEEFEGLLDEALPLSQSVRRGEEANLGAPGRYAYAPIDINGAFHNGHLYYTAQTLKREVEMVRDDSGEEVVAVFEELETVVIRSDRTVHSSVWSKAHRGVAQKNQVLRLSDGTLIDREPQPNKYGTWSWKSISDYLQGKSRTRPLGEILRDVEDYLRASVWLPYEEDYTLLTLVVPVTYAQAIFDSVPILFLNGPAGSGKSQMGRAMARVSANAYVCGQSSAASIARFIDESRGFVVLDDLEAIGNKGGEFSELVQALKQSYNKATATKLWTDVKTMRTERLNFFGCKMINNTQGADQILGSRMLRIQTKKIPDHLKEEFAGLRPAEELKLAELRDELHTWAFENAHDIASTYRCLYPKSTDRADEIAAPLLIMAVLANDADLASRLEIALARQKHRGSEPEDPVQVMIDALRNLVTQGYEMISITHLVLEMRSLIHENYGKGFTTEIPEWARPDWVGKMLRTHDLIEVDPERQERKRLFGAHLRFYPIRRGFIDEVRGTLAERGIEVTASGTEPTAFCQGCVGCIYSLHNCEIMPKRLRIEGREDPR